MSIRQSSVVRFVPGVLIALAGAPSTLGENPFPASINLSELNGGNGFVINGIDADDYSGFSVSSAGDVNGDGVDDLIIGAYRADPNGQGQAGESYVVFGKNTGALGPFAASINLSTLNGTTGFVLNGIDADDRNGRCVSSAGDINGDGVGDVIIGAYSADPDGRANAGESYVVFGKNTGVDGPFTALVNLASLNGATGFVLKGVDAGDESGRSVSAAGDVNGDGIDDLIIGARLADSSDGSPAAGESYVVFGRNTAVTDPFNDVINLSTLDGTAGFRLRGYGEDFHAGFAVAAAGDVNGDGDDDVIIGAPFGEPEEIGRNYVLYGRKTALAGPFSATISLEGLDGTTGFGIGGIRPYDNAGYSVSAAGDVNGDGIGDVLVGANHADSSGHYEAGASYVVFGKNTAVHGLFTTVSLSTLNGLTGFALTGYLTNDRSGTSISTAGDINGDGIDDVIIGAPGVNTYSGFGAGASYVVFGRNTATVGPFAASIGLSSLNGTTGFLLAGIDADDHSGRSVSSAGDVNGDGVDDLIIGAWRADPNGLGDAGESYVVFGRAPIPCPGDINGDGFTNTADFNILAGNFGDGLGATLATGDLSGDGFVNTADFNILAGDFGCVP